jgi:hypothetical protein
MMMNLEVAVEVSGLVTQVTLVRGLDLLLLLVKEEERRLEERRCCLLR